MAKRDAREVTAELVGRALRGDRAALSEVVEHIQDDVYNLALRMTGTRADAEDATQEIALQVVTHLAQWRAEASFRTWVWRIASRHLMRRRENRFEELCSFEVLTGLCAAGAASPALPTTDPVELEVLERELRLVCTEGMLLSLDRDHRLAWILAEVFELDGDDGAAVLEIEPATYRKRLSRARARLGAWMEASCGLVSPRNGCNCRRQIPIAMGAGVLDRAQLPLATHPVRAADRRGRLKVLEANADAMDLAAHVVCGHPDYATPTDVVARIRELVASRSLPLLDG